MRDFNSLDNLVESPTASIARRALDCQVEGCITQHEPWPQNAKFAVMEDPNLTPIFDGLPEQRIRLHLQPLWRGSRCPRPGTKSKLTVCRLC
jgi:hypothetical protein